MKYLKDFSSESDYLDYRYGNEFTNPNVSLCNDKGGLYYNFTPPPITYDYVDFGLPSGRKWATKNVGARKPSDAGFYFQWGDTKGYTANQVGTGDGKKKFADDWSDYKWGASPNFTKYVVHSELELEDDAAHVNMGGDWHMPSPTQIQELIDNTTTAWTTSDGVSGVTFTSKKDKSKSIFIPAAGDAEEDFSGDYGNGGFVWSSMLYTENGKMGTIIDLSIDEVRISDSSRYCGNSVRGIIETSGDTNGYSYVDLGLPSGTLWATMNVGASKPSDYGQYFQWGDTNGYTAEQVGKDKLFNWDNYKFSINGSSTNFSKYGAPVLQLEDDAAHVNMGGEWHMPTTAQFDELFNSTHFKFTTLDGIEGVSFTSKKDESKSIFIPAAGKALNGSIIQSGNGVGIWINQSPSNDNGFCVYIDSSGDMGTDSQRYYGCSIRGVIG